MAASRRRDDEPVSLAPLTPEEALRALLAVKPDDEPRARESGLQDDGEDDARQIGDGDRAGQ